jgi:dipeptidyl-peptidase-4
VLWHDYDDAWVDLVPGVPTLLGDGRLVTTADRDGTRRLLIDGEPVTPVDLQVRSVAAATGEAVVFSANPIDDATVVHVWRWDGTEVAPVADGPGVHSVAVGGATTVIRSATLDQAGSTTTVRTRRGPDGAREFVIESLAEWPLVSPNVEILHVGERRLATAVVLPHDHDGSPLPVLLDPYGGPHALRVLQSSNAFLTAQWFADQGFAVLVTDGRGTPGRGSEWERAVHGDLATAVLSPSRSPGSTCIAWRSAAGASAATSQRWPCCGAPTSSMPPLQGHR